VLAFLNDGPALAAVGAPTVGSGAERYRMGVDEEYRRDDVALEAHFTFFDLESSIDRYEILIFRASSGGDIPIYPAVNALSTKNFTAVSGLTVQTTDIVMDSAAVTSFQAKFVNIRVSASLMTEPLFSGSSYFFRVKAWNLAGSSATSQSNGVFIDATPPVVDVIRVGVLSDEPEDITGEAGTANIPVVISDDPFGIRAYWSASDPQSDIVAYYVAIGMVPRAFNTTFFVPYQYGTLNRFDNNPNFVINCSTCNMTFFSALMPDALPMGSAFPGFIPLNKLQANNFDITPNRFVEGADNAARYVITVAAVNGAGAFSMRSSKPFRVASADIAGTVLDGPDRGIDVAVQNGDTITVTFSGWQTECGGIMSYEWAIGTSPGGSDIQAFTPEGIVTEGDKGTAQVSIDNLQHGAVYYSTVRAVTLCRIQGQQLFDVSDGSTAQIKQPTPQPATRAQYIESVSSGVLMDRTAPDTLQALTLTGTKQPDTTKYSSVEPNSTFFLPIPNNNATLHVVVEAENGRVNNYLIDLYQGTPSSVATLRNISIVQPNTLSLLSFTDDQTNYTASVPFEVSFVTLSAQPTSPAAVILCGLRNMVLYPLAPNTESEPQPLEVGWTTITLKVYAQDKDTVLLYFINIFRAAPSAECRISNVFVSWLNSSQTFAVNSTSALQSLVIPFRAPTVQIGFNSSAVLSRSSVMVAVDASTFSYALVPGRSSPAMPVRGLSVNLTLMTVSQSQESSCTFTLMVTRAAASNNTNLSSLTIAAASTEAVRAPTITLQNSSHVMVATDASSQVVRLNITTSDSRATVELNGVSTVGLLSLNVPLPAGNTSVFLFDVVAESGLRQTRTVIFTRRPASNISSLSSLIIEALNADSSVVNSQGTVANPASNVTRVIGPIAFAQSTLRLRVVFTNAAAQASLYIVEQNSDLKRVFAKSRDTTFTLPLPLEYFTVPFAYVRNVSVLLVVQAEDGASESFYPLTLTYGLPTTVAQLANVSLAYRANRVLLPIAFDAPLTVNTTRLTCTVPFSVSVLSLGAQSLQRGTVRVGISGQTLAALAATSRRDLSFNSSTATLSLAVQVTAEDGITANVVFVDVTRASPSNATNATVRVSLPIAPLAGSNASVASTAADIVLVPTGGLNFTGSVPFNATSVSVQLTAGFPFATAGLGLTPPAANLAAQTFALLGTTTVLTGRIVSESGLLTTPVRITLTRQPGNLDASLREIIVRSSFNDTFVRFTAAQLVSNQASLSAQLAFAVDRVVITASPTVHASTLTLSVGPSTVALVAGVPTAVDIPRGVQVTLVVRSLSESSTTSATARIILSRRPADTNADLQSLSFGNFALSSSFRSNTTSYSLPVFGVSALPIRALLPPGVLYSKISVGLTEETVVPFTSEAATMKIQWTIDDVESGLANATALVLGTFPWASDLLRSTSDTASNTFTFVDFASSVNVTNGLPIGASVQASNTLNVTTQDDSDLLTLDITPPDVTQALVLCPNFTASFTEISCAWYGFRDLESPISHYLFSVGLFPGDDALFSSTFIGWAHHFTAPVSLVHGMQFFVTVTAINSVGMSAQVSSSMISVDQTPPVASGQVWELDDFIFLDWVNRDSSLLSYTHANASDFEFNTMYALGSVVRYQGRVYRSTGIFDSGAVSPVNDRAHWAYLEDSQCQKGRSRLVIQWDAFVDSDSGITQYEVGVGSTIGGNDLTRGWLVFPATTMRAVIVQDAEGNNLILQSGSYVYVSVKAINGVDMVTTIVSNGVGIAAPEITGTIADGRDLDNDLDFQSSPRVMTATLLTTNPCPVVKIETMIVRCVLWVVCVF
jgi:hypothetical protein